MSKLLPLNITYSNRTLTAEPPSLPLMNVHYLRNNQRVQKNEKMRCDAFCNKDPTPWCLAGIGKCTWESCSGCGECVVEGEDPCASTLPFSVPPSKSQCEALCNPNDAWCLNCFWEECEGCFQCTEFCDFLGDDTTSRRDDHRGEWTFEEPPSQPTPTPTPAVDPRIHAPWKFEPTANPPPTTPINNNTDGTIPPTVQSMTRGNKTSAGLRSQLNFYRDGVDALRKSDKISMENLIKGYAEIRDHTKVLGILQGTSGIMSLISSSILIWMIVRSNKGLSTTQHRLLLGLCIFDILSSLSSSTFNAMAPSDRNYVVWNAIGNVTTCDTQGFLMMVGIVGGLFYNCSINIYYLTVVRYGKSNEYIRTKMEKILHAVPIVVALTNGITRLVRKHYNSDPLGNCIMPVQYQDHCHGYDVGEVGDNFKIPCGRGIDGAWAALISYLVLLFVPAFIMMFSLGMVYIAVRKVEKKVSRYGVSTLNLNNPTDNSRKSIWQRILALLRIPMRPPNSRRLNTMQSQSRVVMYKSFAYTFAWFLSYGLYILQWVFWIARSKLPIAIDYIAFICFPLQGFFNLVIFMHPRVISAKKSTRENLTWCQAISTAFWSKGKDRNRRRGARGRSNLRKKGKYRPMTRKLETKKLRTARSGYQDVEKRSDTYTGHNNNIDTSSRTESTENSRGDSYMVNVHGNQTKKSGMHVERSL